MLFLHSIRDSLAFSFARFLKWIVFCFSRTLVNIFIEKNKLDVTNTDLRAPALNHSIDSPFLELLKLVKESFKDSVDEFCHRLFRGNFETVELPYISISYLWLIHPSIPTLRIFFCGSFTYDLFLSCLFRDYSHVLVIFTHFKIDLQLRELTDPRKLRNIKTKGIPHPPDEGLDEQVLFPPIL